MSLLQH